MKLLKGVIMNESLINKKPARKQGTFFSNLSRSDIEKARSRHQRAAELLKSNLPHWKQARTYEPPNFTQLQKDRWNSNRAAQYDNLNAKLQGQSKYKRPDLASSFSLSRGALKDYLSSVPVQEGNLDLSAKQNQEDLRERRSMSTPTEKFDLGMQGWLQAQRAKEKSRAYDTGFAHQNLSEYPRFASAEAQSVNRSFPMENRWAPTQAYQAQAYQSQSPYFQNQSYPSYPSQAYNNYYPQAQSYNNFYRGRPQYNQGYHPQNYQSGPYQNYQRTAYPSYSNQAYQGAYGAYNHQARSQFYNPYNSGFQQRVTHQRYDDPRSRYSQNNYDDAYGKTR